MDASITNSHTTYFMWLHSFIQEPQSCKSVFFLSIDGIYISLPVLVLIHFILLLYHTVHVDTQSSFQLHAYWISTLCQDQSVSKVEVKSLALLVANYEVHEVVFYSAIIIPRSAYPQPLLVLLV